jgi:DNA-binding response OmpR family regulator
MLPTTAKGLELLKEFTYDLLLLDLMIPEISGLDLLKTVRSWAKYPRPYNNSKKLKRGCVKGLDHRSDDYLTKPFSFDGITRSNTCPFTKK